MSEPTDLQQQLIRAYRMGLYRGFDICHERKDSSSVHASFFIRSEANTTTDAEILTRLGFRS